MELFFIGVVSGVSSFRFTKLLMQVFCLGLDLGSNQGLVNFRGIKVEVVGTLGVEPALILFKLVERLTVPCSLGKLL